MLVVISFSVGVGPLVIIGSSLGDLDRNDIYLVISFEPVELLAVSFSSVGGRELGPSTSRFSSMVMLPPNEHANLKSAGYRILPASIFAGICGVSVNPDPLASRS